MERPVNSSGHERVINITSGDVASTSVSHVDDHNDSDELHYEDRPSTRTQAPTSQSPSLSAIVLNSRNESYTRRGDNRSRLRRSPLNSGFWISIELIVNLGQIIAAVIVLSLSRDEHPQTPLFAWIIGYTAGCVATLPHLYWRYIHHHSQGSVQETEHSHQRSSQDNLPDSTSYTTISATQAVEGDGRHSMGRVLCFGRSLAVTCPRLPVLIDHLKMALDCFFAVWFVVGNVWIFGGRSSATDAPNLYRLCIAFLTFTCIGYPMPFILCAAICCCLPCIISVFGFREDLSQTRGATAEVINALPTYRFKSKRSRNKERNEISSESLGEGGILGADTDKERIISAEDAVCCICLARYADNDELRELPCSHLFHLACVDKWLKINGLCPLCKSEIGVSAGPLFSTYFGHRRGNRTGSGSDAAVAEV